MTRYTYSGQALIDGAWEQVRGWLLARSEQEVNARIRRVWYMAQALNIAVTVAK